MKRVQEAAAQKGLWLFFVRPMLYC